MVTLVWLRQDLRLTDNPALTAAIARGRPVVPVYVLDDAAAGSWAAGGATRWWLHGSLEALAAELGARGSRLILRRGPAEAALERLAAKTQATAVYWNRCYEPWAIARDTSIKTRLGGQRLDVQSFNAALLAEPWALKTRDGRPYRVFTPFWKALRSSGEPQRPAPAPGVVPAPAAFPRSDDLGSWRLRPTSPDWAGGLRAAWQPGEAGARTRLDAFAGEIMLGYAERRDRPGTTGTSRLSPHLHFGEISPRHVWHTVVSRALSRTGGALPTGAETFLSELAWREFSYHLLFHVPSLPEQPLRGEFAGFPWSDDPGQLRAWQRGQTGYPIVDAGMRELWHTGWMHNRVRMIVASFLVKDLLIDWRRGQAWFWDTLVDADLANNAASWQWVAGCGADAAPYFRIFNPSLQGDRFDADGAYVRHWVPEIARLPDRFLQAPWQAPATVLADAGITLGRTYPLPIVDHAAARLRALDLCKTLKKKS
jgi:deoxyribodipyrimidine photo-lyase